MSDSSIIKQIDEKSEELKNLILNSKSQSVFSGTAYYLSENGNDTNDGLTPETALKTLEALERINFCEGDAIFLERGSIFRGGINIEKDGMLLSSYGDGEKPRVYGSPRNYNIVTDWIETNIENVYCCCDTFDVDIGNIVFNDGEAYAFKQIIGNFGFCGQIIELNSDLMMFHDEHDKKLYLCSKCGNPAERFNSIEICPYNPRIRIKANGVTVDNVCFKYFGAHAVTGINQKGLTVRNCEFGWIGGSIQHFEKERNMYIRYGNAIEVYADAQDFTACYNYIYQVYDTGISHQYFNDAKNLNVKMFNCNYHHNLIEYCSYSIEYALTKQTTDMFYAMKDINLSDNIMRFAGYGFGDQRPDRNAAAHIKTWEVENKAENFHIENNIIDRSRFMLIHIAADKKEWLPEFKGNIYVQNMGEDMGRYGVKPTKMCRYSEAEEFLSFDENSKYYII